MSGQLNGFSKQVATPMVYYRGGPGKAAISDRQYLAVEEDEQFAACILAAYGSPDRRQIDGLGGAGLLTSKSAVVGPPTRPDADIDSSEVSGTTLIISTMLRAATLSAVTLTASVGSRDKPFFLQLLAGRGFWRMATAPACLEFLPGNASRASAP